MNFPDFVPLAVRNYISILVEGDEREPHGWAVSLANTDRELAEIDNAIRRTNPEARANLNKERIKTARSRDMLADFVETFQRVGTDDRMRECYAFLKSEPFNDEQLKRFIHCAWAARMDYSKYRKRLKEAVKISGAIAKSADRLARLLRQLLDTGVPNPPDEFYSIHALLSQTDHAEGKRGERNWGQHGYWRGIRRDILGDTARDVEKRDPAAPSNDGGAKSIIVHRILEPGERVGLDPQQATRNSLHYAWQQAPPVSEMIEAIVRAARHFEPSEYGMVGAAIAKRERSTAQNKEYLRAFGQLLEDHRPRITRTRAVTNAIAVVATVAINDRDFVVSYDDVVKAIGRPVETQP